jgi:hypothetical protein
MLHHQFKQVQRANCIGGEIDSGIINAGSYAGAGGKVDHTVKSVRGEKGAECVLILDV